MTNKYLTWASIFCMVAVLSLPASLAIGAELGIVVLHGKGGTPTGYVQALSSALQNKGYIVSTPNMPWSKDRIYDKTYAGAILEIDQEIINLRKQGAKQVVVAGQSLGANVVLGYAASRSSIDGLIVISAGHAPESDGFASRLGQQVSRAQVLIAQGRGKEKQKFSDINQGKLFEVSATAEDYFTWFDPQGAAVMSKSASAIQQATPLLVVNGNGDRNAPSKEAIFDKAPPHPKSKFVVVSADHFSAPTVAIEEVLAWLDGLKTK